MKFILLFILPLLVALVVAYPQRVEEDNKKIVTVDYYPESFVIYEGKHDIVDIVVPINAFTELDSYESKSEIKNHLTFFFVEADMAPESREEHGIYVYKHGKAIKLTNNGRAIAASADDSAYVFFGTKEGLFTYNPETEKAVRYGDFNNSIKSIAKEQNSDVIYILTDDRELYEVYDAATSKIKIDDVKDAEQIMMDYSNNLYYYSKDKKTYVRTLNGEIKKIQDLPEKPHELKLFKSSMFNNEGVGLMIDNELYTIYPDGTSKPDGLKFMPDAKPTAYSIEAGIFYYIGYKKKIYEYDLLNMNIF